MNNTSYKILNAWQLKLIMVCLMVLDHLHYIDGLLSPNLAHIFNIISRCVAPVFAYLAIEGIIHTKNLKRYNIRLLSAAIIMCISNVALSSIQRTYSADLAAMKSYQLISSNNIFLTLAMGVLCISLILYGKKKIGAQKYIIYLLGILSFMIGFFGEWGVVLLPFMLVVYFLRGKKKPRWFSYLGIELLAILFNSEYFYFIAFPFIAIYDGKRGPNTRFNKYFFYVFYIAHIWIIAFIDFWRRGAFL